MTPQPSGTKLGYRGPVIYKPEQFLLPKNDKQEPVLVPQFFNKEDDTVRMRVARAAFIAEMFVLHPEGFRKRSAKNPLDMTYVDQAHVEAKLTTAPKATRSAKGKARRDKRLSFMAGVKKTPERQHMTNWQRHHKGELHVDSVMRRAIDGGAAAW